MEAIQLAESALRWMRAGVIAANVFEIETSLEHRVASDHQPLNDSSGSAAAEPVIKPR